MLFNSYIFMFLFLPAMLLLWYGCNHFGKYRAAELFLVLMSLWFYGYYNHKYVWIILTSILGNWIVSRFVEKSPRLIGAVGILLNLGLLFYFKYYDFFIENINAVFRGDLALHNIALPLGISFFTFQQISYIGDRMKGEAPHYKLLHYMSYVTYFPQLIAGPIVSHDKLVPQFFDRDRRRLNWENVLSGTRLFCIGLGKKVLIADRLGRIADFGFGDPGAMDSVGALAVMLSYTFQIFFDFSGYCDMAMGIGRMMNLELPQNFCSPYKSGSVKEFWNRWHITLGEFFTKYVYIPLGGNRCGMVRGIGNILIVFLLSGIWHGANWTFVLWGIAHGLMVSLEKFPFVNKIHRGLRWFLTFGFVNLAWVLFRSDSISTAALFYRRLFSFTNTDYIWVVAGKLQNYSNHVLYLFANSLGGYSAARMLYMVLLVLMLALAGLLCMRRDSVSYVEEKRATWFEMCFLAGVAALSVLSFSGVAVFLYFNF